MLRDLLLIVVFTFISSSICFADLNPDQIRSAKRATALVETSGRVGRTVLIDGKRVEVGGGSVPTRAYGSAFCIDTSGLFVTNAHVSEMAGGNTISIVLNPTENDQKVVAATVVRTDKQLDLTILRIDPANVPKDLSALELGSTKDLLETQTLTAFGFPFGKNLAMERGDYPSVSVNLGRITSLRKKRASLNSFSLMPP